MTCRTALLVIAFFLLSSAGLAPAVIIREWHESSKGHELVFLNAEKKEIAREEFDKTGKLKKTDGVIPDGPFKQYYDDGKIQSEGTYKDGKQEGPAKSYDMKEKLSSEGNYKNGRLEGLYRWFYPDGKVKETCDFKAGEMEGAYKWYFEDGGLQAEGSVKDSYLDGAYKSYFESGKVKEEKVFDKGREMSCKTYDEDGKLIKETKQ